MARGLLAGPSSSSQEAGQVLSVTSDVTAGAPLQAAPPKLTLPDPTQANDSFAALVDSNLPAFPAIQPAPEPDPPAPPVTQDTPAQAPADTSPTADTAASAQAPSNPTTNPSADGASQPAADTGPVGTSANGSTAASPQGGTKPATSKSGSAKSTDNAASSAGSAGSTQPYATQVTTAIPLAATISLTGSTPTRSASSAEPLAIAAAAIAKSSSTTAALTATPSPGKVESPEVSAPAGAPNAVAKVAAQANVQATVQATTTAATPTKQPGTPADPTLDADVELTAAVATPGATAAKPTAPAKSATAGTAAATATPTSTSAPAQAPSTASNGTATPQQLLASSGHATNTTAEQTNLNGTASPSPSASTPASRGQISISTDPQGSTTPANNSAQVAAFTLPPQAASTAPTAPSFTVTPATGAPVPLSGLAVEIAASVQGGRTRFEVRLDPADLGQIDVRIDVDRSGLVTSHLTVEKPETLSMLQQSAPQLQQALNDAGLKTGSGGLQFSLRDQSSSGQNGNGNLTNGNAHRLVISEEDTVSPAVAGLYGRSAGTSGGIDIRV
jgi:flagellar hook-length control protein FliK